MNEIEKVFNKYVSKVYSETLNEFQYNELKRAFYAGIAYANNYYLNTGKEDDEYKAIQKLYQLNRELESYIENQKV